MTISEEKVKEFLGNEENLKAIASDEEFLKKVSGGMATAETYKEEFKKFGIDLSAEEAKKVEEETKKYLSMPPEKLQKLTDDALGGIAGGSNPAPAICCAVLCAVIAISIGTAGALAECALVESEFAPSQPTYKVPEYNSIDYDESATANPYDSIKK